MVGTYGGSPLMSGLWWQQEEQKKGRKWYQWLVSPPIIPVMKADCGSQEKSGPPSSESGLALMPKVKSTAQNSSLVEEDVPGGGGSIQESVFPVWWSCLQLCWWEVARRGGKSWGGSDDLRGREKKKERIHLKCAAIRQTNAENGYKVRKHRNKVGKLQISTRSDRELRLHK